MKRFPFILLVAGLFPLACNQTYTVGPLSASSSSNNVTVTTLAGQAGVTGVTNATGSAASFNVPSRVAVDSAGNVYVTDSYNQLVREISPAGVVSTLAGQAGVTGATNATGTAASFSYPWGVAVDSAGNVYVADSLNQLVRKIVPGGVVSTFAGSLGVMGFANGTGSSAIFNGPNGVAVDSPGNLYVADLNNEMVRTINPGAGVGWLAGQPGVCGFTNGSVGVASLCNPSGVAVDTSGNIYVADFGNSAIRKITPGGVVSTLAGGTQGYANGTGTAAAFNFPVDVAVDGAGNVYVADFDNSVIRKITPAGVVSTLAGQPGVAGFMNGTGTSALFNGPEGVAVNAAGTTVYVADENNNAIREIIQ